jgi:hypothetical protein
MTSRHDAGSEERAGRPDVVRVARTRSSSAAREERAGHV